MTHELRVALAILLAIPAACRSSGESAGPDEIRATPAPLAARLDDPTGGKPGFIAALAPRQSADVMAPYTSPSASLLVKLGDTVTKGQLLARLDDRQLRQELDAARAQLRTAEAAVTQAEVDKRGAEIVLARETAAETAGVGSHADVVAAGQAVARADATITVTRATVDERSTRIAQLQARLQEMALVAPITGRVAMIYPQDGARVEEGRPVIRLISGALFVKFAIPADQVGSLKPGDPVDVRVDRRDDLVTATVGHISPELDAVAQMIIADADLVNPPADLQPGTVCRILPRTSQRAPALPPYETRSSRQR
ncbi:MAG TPA: HlyD family efflux transporter periplasmic adaptor subunit [Kofleriaceae bacterium]|jgi:RND family efflux transporter MFP subunit|nr:HlyD family efflux transporter periplasmic adaptor subunit [Kofleriaceae bacterium]